MNALLTELHKHDACFWLTLLAALGAFLMGWGMATVRASYVHMKLWETYCSDHGRRCNAERDEALDA